MPKKIISFTIDEQTFKEFNEYAAKHHINKSGLIQELLESYLRSK